MTRSVHAVSYGRNMRPAYGGEHRGVYAEGANRNARLIPGVSEMMETEEVVDADWKPRCTAETKSGEPCNAAPIVDTVTCWFHGERA
jgi:hypothetical protein